MLVNKVHECKTAEDGGYPESRHVRRLSGGTRDGVVFSRYSTNEQSSAQRDPTFGR